jgi:SpoVK/Ycf46/Vps4 family AAA+-type ATPase
VTSDPFLDELELLLRSRHPIIFIETQEEDRVQSQLLYLAEKLKLLFYTWSRTKGLKEYQQFNPSEHLTISDALTQVEFIPRKAIYNFQGLGEELEDKFIATKLCDSAKQFLQHDGSIIITGPIPDEIPQVIKPLSTVIRLPLPSRNDLKHLTENLYRDLAKRAPVAVHVTKEEMNMILQNLQGMTLLEAEKVLTKAMLEDHQLGPQDIERVAKAKKHIVERDGLLEFYPIEHSLKDLAGLKGLKSWLEKRRAIIQDSKKAKDFGLSFPKGILILGVQGTGKSLCAKAVAADWGLPLLKMDSSRLYNKYIGESEKNLKRATEVAEQVSPVVLWIDEIEKAFASGGDMDGGLSKRVLGNFLTWLQERKGDVFVVATANDISQLPPELLRKGRFDEIFFVDLPDQESRLEILGIHLEKRKRSRQQFDLEKLAASTEGFSGAELEQVIVSTLYSAFHQNSELNTELILNEIKQTVPLSQTMQEKLNELRTWASGRFVSAN